jgi:hypothetical protein
MVRSLSGKLAAVLMLVFFLIGIGFILATEHMLEGRRLIELTTGLVVSAIAFSLLAALVVFNLLTRRLSRLAAAMDAFRESGFTRPIRFGSTNRRRDEIERLGTTFQELSERVAGQIKEQERIETQRRELLANVSHDLRTPLASMQGYLETLLLRHGTLTPEEERNYLEVAAKHTERLGKLINDLFQLTKLEAHDIKPQFEAFSLVELAQDVAQKFQLKADKRGLLLECHLSPQVPWVNADIGMIERILENLIENAIRHTGSGGVIRVTVEPAGERVRIRISDTGHGIPSEELPNVFERYYKVSRGEVGDAGSTGLGLAITRHVVELHGGHIQVESTVGVGTTFRFDLPVAALS